MMVAMALRMLVRAVVMLVAALAVAITINAQSHPGHGGHHPTHGAGHRPAHAPCSKVFYCMQRRIDALNNTTQENLVAIRVVKAFVRQVHEKAKFKKSNDELTAATMKVDMTVVLILPIMTLT